MIEKGDATNKPSIVKNTVLGYILVSFAISLEIKTIPIKHPNAKHAMLINIFQ